MRGEDSVKFQLGKLFVQLGREPHGPNSYSIRFGEGSSPCRLDVGAFAESFDSALSFYIDFTRALTSLSDSCWFELRTWRPKRLPKAIGSKVPLQGFTLRGGFYGDVGAEQLSSVFNSYWLGTTPRIFGALPMPASSALEMATALTTTNIQEIRELPQKAIFVAEKQLRGPDEYFTVLFRPNHINEVKTALVDSSTANLKHPLLEAREDFS